MARTIRLSDERILRTKSRGCCSICRRDLAGGDSDSESNLSEMAHVRGLAAGSARHDPSMDPDAVNRHANLILLCPDCHKIVDDNPDKYTADRLVAIKPKFEKWARRQLVRDSRMNSFAELEVVTKWMATASPVEPEGDYSVTPPLKKIKKNGLSHDARAWIEVGMSRSHLVGKYVEAQPDPMFGERLKERFRKIYRHLREDEGLDGEDTFFCMLGMDANVSDIKAKTPSVLAVLVYLFEKCEVFEK